MNIGQYKYLCAVAPAPALLIMADQGL
jgi:hypothetical protein